MNIVNPWPVVHSTRITVRVTSTPDEVAYNHERDPPGISPNRKRETTVDERFLARGTTGLDISWRCRAGTLFERRLESQHAGS